MKVFELRSSTWYELEPLKVVWVKSPGELIFEHEPGVRILCGADTWGYHVWGAKAYSACMAKGITPIVLVEGEPTDIFKDPEGWLTIAFGAKSLKPWAPISLYVKGVDKPVRKGTLVAVP